MKKRSKFAGVLAVFLVVLLLVGCSGSTPSPSQASAKTQEDELYYMIVYLKGQEYFNWCFAGMLAAAEDIGPHVKVEMQGPVESDASLQAKTINQLIAKKPNGMLVAAADAATLTSSINQAVEAGIPVITFDGDTPDSKRLTYIGTDNYLFGALAADYIGEKCGGKGEVAVVYVPGFVALEERADGFTQRLNEKYPDMKISAYLNGECDAVKSEQVCTAQLQTNPNINAIFCTDGSTPPGAAAAVRTVNRTGEVTVVASDFGSSTLEMLREGSIPVTIVDDPYMMGYQSMLQIYAAAHPTDVVSNQAPFGHVPKSSILFGAAMLTAEDIAKPEVSEKYDNPPTF
jgi:ribose transport system substrate-binding protein